MVEFSESRLCIRAWNTKFASAWGYSFATQWNYINSHFCWWRTAYLIQPYSRRTLDRSKAIFNYRLSRARLVAESAFGICASKRRILDKAIETKVDTGVDIVKCISLLHNIIIDFEDYCCLHSRRLQRDSLSLPPTRATRKQRTNQLGRCYQPGRLFCTLTRYTLRRRAAPCTYMCLSAQVSGRETRVQAGRSHAGHRLNTQAVTVHERVN
jgi:hypothetical protein